MEFESKDQEIRFRRLENKWLNAQVELLEQKNELLEALKLASGFLGMHDIYNEETNLNNRKRVVMSLEERKKLISEFQKWLDINPNKNILASECATIAERYAQQRVNEVLDKIEKQYHKIPNNNPAFNELVKLEKLIYKLKNNEK